MAVVDAGHHRPWDHSELAPVSVRPPIAQYLRQLWDRRHFIHLHARSQALGQHQGTVLGRAWLLLAPLMDGMVYWLIFGVAFGLRADVPDFVPRLLVGILLFTYFSRALTAAANSLASSRGLIRAFSFPRASLPVSSVLRETYAAAPMLPVLLLLVVVVPPHSAPSWTWLLLPLPIALIACFTCGVGLILARVVTVVPDVSKLLGYALRFAMYGSGVIFSVDRFGDHPVLNALLTNNPIYIFIEMARQLLLYSTVPPPLQWLTLSASGLAALVVGIIIFWRGEASYGKQRVA